MLDAGARVTAVEMDRHLVPALVEAVGPDAVRVIVGDAMRVEIDAMFADAPDAPWRVISNLPYNVATPIVMRLLEAAPTVTSILVMVQREVGERFAAGPGSKTYGAVSVKVSYFASAKVVGIVPPTVFVPAPKVESALVRIERHPAPPVDVPSPDHLFALVRAGFGQRRKMLRGALRVALGERLEEVLATAGVDGRVRAEELSLADWAAIARAAG